MQLLCALFLFPGELQSVLHFCVFIDEYSALTREQGQSPAPHTLGAKIWDDPGVFYNGPT